MLKKLCEDLVSGGGGGKRRERLTYHHWFFETDSHEYFRREEIVIDDVPYRGPNQLHVQHEGALEGPIIKAEVPQHVREKAAAL